MTKKLLLFILVIILILWVFTYMDYTSLDSQIARADDTRKEVAESLAYTIHIDSLKNSDSEALISLEQQAIQERNIEIKNNQWCMAANYALKGTTIAPVSCDETLGMLYPSELFYTFKVSDNPVISQHEENHFHKWAWWMLATDIATSFWQAEQFALDYFWEVKAYTVRSFQNECVDDILDDFYPNESQGCKNWKTHLWNHIELSFNHKWEDMKFVLWHIDSKLSDGDIVFTGQKIWQTNVTGTTTGHHVHIELWSWKHNISYSVRNKELLESRSADPIKKETTTSTESTNDFTYTPIVGDGNLSPDSQKYKDAWEKYGIDWRMISAIHCTETFDIKAKSCSRHTKSPTSSAWAQWCMQFMPKTWTWWLASSTWYWVDGDWDWVADIHNCMDGIHSAANKLSSNYNKFISEWSTPEQARWKAYRQYNHANWYADRAANIFNTLTK